MKKTIKKRAFISAIAMLIVSAIVLTSSTFAWFSMAKQGTVDMDLTIASPDGIQISANTSAFTTALTMADFKGESGSRYAAYTDNINNFPAELSPLSSTLILNTEGGMLPRFYKGTINEDTGLFSASKISEVGENGLVAFDIFVQLAADKDVSIANSTIECAENPEVVTAMRMATINCGVVAKASEASDIQAVKPTAQSVGGTNVAQIIEPNRASHTQIATEKGASGVMSTNPINASITNKAMRTDYPNVYNHNNGGCMEVSAGTSGTIKARTGINRIRVYIWMEGQDVDCANDVAGAALKVNLKFDIN